MQEYINKIIKTGLANGLTMEQMMSDPKKAHKAYLDAQLLSIAECGQELFNELKSK